MVWAAWDSERVPLTSWSVLPIAPGAFVCQAIAFCLPYVSRSLPLFCQLPAGKPESRRRTIASRALLVPPAASSV